MTLEVEMEKNLKRQEQVSEKKEELEEKMRVVVMNPSLSSK